MNPETGLSLRFAEQLPLLLSALGVGLQHLRGHRWISDWFTMPLGFLVTVGGLAMCVDWKLAASDWQAFSVEAVVSLPGYLSVVFTTMFASQATPLAPVTDSK